VALFILGIFLKRSEKVADWLIPFILLPIGIAFCCVILGDIVDGFLQGILTTGAAVLVNNLIKQGTERQ